MKPSEFQIRELSPEDSLESLTALLHSAYAALGAMGLNYTAVDQPVEVTARRVSRGRCFVAVLGAEIVGTISVGPAYPGSSCAYYGQPHLAVANQLAVAPEHQRRGIGSALMERAEAWARAEGFRELAGDTAESAAHLIEYYARRGYRQVALTQWRGKRYRSVILAKELTPAR